MSQPGPALFYEDWYAALRDDAKAIGRYERNWAKVTGRLVNSAIEDPEAAARWLDDRLNPNRRERLSDEQERLIIRLATRERGWSAAMFFLADDTGYVRPSRRDPDVERDRLTEVVASTAATLQRALDELARLRERDSITTSAVVSQLTRERFPESRP